MRVSSLTLPPAIGTLRSTRTSTRLPVRSRGAVFSRASRMAVSAIAAGVTIVEVRAIGLSGATSASTGRRSPAPGISQFIAQIAAAEARPGPFVYYEIWLRTFEELLAGKGLVTGAELDETTYQFEFGERDDVY